MKIFVYCSLDFYFFQSVHKYPMFITTAYFVTEHALKIAIRHVGDTQQCATHVKRVTGTIVAMVNVESVKMLAVPRTTEHACQNV